MWLYHQWRCPERCLLRYTKNSRKAHFLWSCAKDAKVAKVLCHIPDSFGSVLTYIQYNQVSDDKNSPILDFKAEIFSKVGAQLWKVVRLYLCCSRTPPRSTLTHKSRCHTGSHHVHCRAGCCFCKHTQIRFVSNYKGKHEVKHLVRSGFALDPFVQILRSPAVWRKSTGVYIFKRWTRGAPEVRKIKYFLR